MGLELIAGSSDPAAMADIVIEVVTSPKEKIRKLFALRRVNLYKDNFEGILEDRVTLVFKEQSVRQRLMALIPMAGSTSFLKRVADELARPIYARAPGRRVIMPDDIVTTVDADGVDKNMKPLPLSSAQEAWNGLVKEAKLNKRMDLVSRLLVACTSVLLFVRYVEGIGLVVDIMTPDCFSVVKDPRVPQFPLAVCYEKDSYVNGRMAKSYVVWDDKRYFTIDAAGNVVSEPVEHKYGRIPFVVIHRRDAWGDAFLDETTGKDLESAALICMFLDLIAVKKHKSQSHIQLAYTGDADAIAKDQTLDEESILIISGGGNGQLVPINLESDAATILATKTSVQKTAAANYGLSLDRLNQTTGDIGEDQGLRERIAEIVAVMNEAENDLFDLAKIISKRHDDPSKRLPDEAKQIVDFGPIYTRGDRMKQLQIRAEEKGHGIRSTVDDVLEDNPEFCADRALAFDYINQKMAEEAVVIARRRALNIPEDATMGKPGSSPEDNGVLGPAVRDGVISADEAKIASKIGTQIPK